MIPYEKYSELRQELVSIRIDLDPDPAATGIGVLNEKIAEVHALKDRVSSILAEAITNSSARERIHAEAKVLYETKFDTILYQDDTIKNLKSEGLRRAAVNAQLPEDYGRMCATKIDLGEAESFQKLVQSKYNLLDSANTNISRQISVIQMQLDIGEVERKEGNPFRQRNIGIKGAS